MDFINGLVGNGGDSSGVLPDIIFVDDEPFVLQLLQTLAAKIEIGGGSIVSRCMFVSSGKRALELITERLEQGKDVK